MKLTITFEVDELPTWPGDRGATIAVIKDAIDHDLANLEVWAKHLAIEVEE